LADISRKTGMSHGWLVPNTMLAACSTVTVSARSAIAASRAAIARLPAPDGVMAAPPPSRARAATLGTDRERQGGGEESATGYRGHDR
jgi:hypothetical protein